MGSSIIFWLVKFATESSGLVDSNSLENLASLLEGIVKLGFGETQRCAFLHLSGLWVDLWIIEVNPPRVSLPKLVTP